MIILQALLIFLGTCEQEPRHYKFINKQAMVFEFDQHGCHRNKLEFAAIGENRNRYVVICKTEDDQLVGWKEIYDVNQHHMTFIVPPDFIKCALQFADGPVDVFIGKTSSSDLVCIDEVKFSAYLEDTLY